MRNIDEQIRKNEKLIYFVIQRGFPGQAKDEDLLQCARIGLWKAAENWDGVRDFAPFACACIRNAIRNYLRDKNSVPPAISFEEWQEGEEPAAIPADGIISLFRPGTMESKVADLLAAGHQKQEVAKILGVHPQTVSRICGKIKEEIEKQGEA